MDLRALQHAFADHVLGNPSNVATEVVCNDGEEATERLSIYGLAYTARLTDALADTFPKLQRALGENSFAQHTRAFALAEPSRFRSVRDYGAELGKHISHRERGVRAQGLQELAHWEWTLADTFDAPDDVSTPDLASVPPERWGDLQFNFDPSLRRVTTHTNSVQWWRAEDDKLPTRWRRLTKPTHWMIWRKNHNVYFRPLPDDEQRALDLALSGATFGEVCTSLAHADEADDSAAMRAAQNLHRWLADEWVRSAQLR